MMRAPKGILAPRRCLGKPERPNVRGDSGCKARCPGSRGCFPACCRRLRRGACTAPFRAVEVGHLGQQGIGHEEQAHVMEECCVFHLFDFTLGQRQFGGDADAVVSDLQGMHI